MKSIRLAPYSLTIALLPLTINAFAEQAKDDIQDMSDPLAVYTQAGVGLTDKGLNVKVGQAYDTGDDDTMGMNIFELKGLAGDTLGWGSSTQKNNPADSFRFRNFSVNLTNGRGTQIDFSYNLNDEAGIASYSLLQALPKVGAFQFYPLAGAGLAVANNAIDDSGLVNSGYSFPGTIALIGMYAKATITDKIWLNYNPVWTTTLSGANNFKNYGLEGDSKVLAHEFIVSYQLNPRSNIRLFANWSNNTDLPDGDHRIEYNYQL